MNTSFSSLLLVTLVLFQVGCATYDKSRPMPKQKEAVSFEVLDKNISPWNDVTVGAYIVPDSQVVMSGHQSGGGAGALFGVLGVVIEHSVGQASGKKGIADIKEKLAFRLTGLVERSLSAKLASGEFSPLFSTGNEQAQYLLSVSPMLVLTRTEDENHYRPFTMLNTSLKSKASGEEVWSSRYTSSLGKSRLLVGADSWLENDKQALNAFLVKNLDASIEVMLKDFASPYERKQNAITVEGHLPFLKGVYRVLANQMTEDEQSLVFLLRQPDTSLLSGVNIVDKTQVIHRKAVAKDKEFIRIKTEQEKKREKELLEEACEQNDC